MIDDERYRFGYQGQFAEYDPETGYNHFEARLLDTRIGRWLATDPAGQFFSPYVSMGNNPMNGVDPNGRLFGKLRAQFFTFFNGGSYDKLNGNWVARNDAGLVVKNFGGSWFKGTNEWNTSIEFGELEFARIGEEETWHYGVQRDHPGDEGHSFIRTADNIIYEINHPKDGAIHGFTSWRDGGPKAIGYKYDMSSDYDKIKFWEFRDGRRMATLQPVVVYDPGATRAFFESWVGKSWNYKIHKNNCKHYIFQGINHREAHSTVKFWSPVPTEWPGEYIEPMYNPFRCE